MNADIIIELTLHARERMQLRLGVNPQKMQKVAYKAWICEHWDKWTYQKLDYQRQFREDGKFLRYRQAYGKIWVFRIIHSKRIRLLTIY